MSRFRELPIILIRLCHLGILLAMIVRPVMADEAYDMSMAGNRCIDHGQYSEAIPYLSRAISLYRNRQDTLNLAEVYSQRGLAFCGLNDFDRGFEDLNEAMRVDPRCALACDNRAFAYQHLAQYDSAIQDCNEAIRLDPGRLTAYINRGISYGALEQYEKAIHDFNEAIRLEPGIAYAYFARGVIFKKLGQYDSAVVDNSEAIRLEPQNASAYNMRGNSYFSLGQYDKAIQDYNEAISLDPTGQCGTEGRGYAFRNRGNAYYMLRQYNSSAADYRLALSLDGWRSNISQYSAIYGYFAYSHSAKDIEANAFISEALDNCDSSVWPFPAIRFLNSDISFGELLSIVTDTDQMTEARTFIGLALATTGNTAEARNHFRWVLNNGNRRFTEYRITLDALRILESGTGTSHAGIE